MLSLRRKSGFLSAILLGQLFLSIFAGATVTYGAGHSKAPEGLAIWGKDLSGLTEEEAFKILEGEIPRSVIYKEKEYPLEIDQSRKDLQSWLHNQYSPKTGLWITDAFEYIKHLNYSPEAPQKLDQDEILPQLQKLSQVTDWEGKPAHLSYENGELSVEEGISGSKLNIEESWNALLNSVDNRQVSLVVDSIDVHPTTSELQQVNEKLGDYTTYFNPDLRERVNNVKLAAKALDGLIIPPGGEFSFNETVGKRDRQTGYLPSIVFVDNKLVLDDGGGICQDSSTLYQAVRQANLRILEKNSHSLPVYYVPVGQDATVAYGLLDFRFKNNTQGYLFISARTGTNWLRIRIFGMSDVNHPPLNAPDGYPVRPENWVKDPK
jgi:vancomycin resistance protein YoaR